MRDEGCVAAGFTLLEIMVALTVMIIGMSCLFSLFLAATALHKRARSYTTAAIIADSVFADLQKELTPDADLAPLAKKDITLDEYPRYTYSIDIFPLDLSEQELYIRVSVRWKSRGTARMQYFETVMLRNLAFKERKQRRYGDTENAERNKGTRCRSPAVHGAGELR